MTRLEEGYTSVAMKDSDECYSAPLEDFTRLRADFMNGKAFLEFDTVYGQKAVIRTLCVESVVSCPPEAIKKQIQSRKEERELEEYSD